MTDEAIQARLIKRPQVSRVTVKQETVIVDFKCIFCGKKYARIYTRQGIENWLGGDYVQVALPEVSTDDREALITGICSFCFDSTYKED